MQSCFILYIYRVCVIPKMLCSTSEMSLLWWNVLVHELKLFSPFLLKLADAKVIYDSPKCDNL